MIASIHTIFTFAFVYISSGNSGKAKNVNKLLINQVTHECH